MKPNEFLKEDEQVAPVAPSTNPTDTVTVDIPLMIRLMEYSKEDAQDDMALHKVAEQLTSLSQSGKTLTMADYDSIVGGQQGVEEGISDTIKKGVKSVKRGWQGWGHLNDIPDDDPRLLPGAKDTPRQLVARNKGYDDKTVKLLSKFRNGYNAQRIPDKHSPAALQQRVLDREMKKRGMQESELNEFAPDGFNDGGEGDDDQFSQQMAKMAQDEGNVKGASLSDGATLAAAFKITSWDSAFGGMYKQYFAQGFKEGRMGKINWDNRQYKLNLKLQKDGSIKHGDVAVDEGSFVHDNTPQAKTVDMTGKKCEKCGKGRYQETSQMDDMDGVLHCTNCGHKVKRHRTFNRDSNVRRWNMDESDGGGTGSSSIAGGAIPNLFGQGKTIKRKSGVGEGIASATKGKK
jgi:hypothetical protein